MCEFMDKMLKANKKELIREVFYSHSEVLKMSLDEIKTNAMKISSEAIWSDLEAKQLFNYKVLKARAPTILKKGKKITHESIKNYLRTQNMQ